MKFENFDLDEIMGLEISEPLMLQRQHFRSNVERLHDSFDISGKRWECPAFLWDVGCKVQAINRRRNGQGGSQLTLGMKYQTIFKN